VPEAANKKEIMYQGTSNLQINIQQTMATHTVVQKTRAQAVPHRPSLPDELGDPLTSAN
jgi:hypothetical protein